jgi:uncharacterized protein (TIGR02231 family)
MIATRLRLAAAAALLGLVLGAGPARAEVVSAVLYPGSALVTEEQTLTLVADQGLAVGVLTLPAGADADTLGLQPLGQGAPALAGLEARPVRRVDEGRLREVRAALEREEAKAQALADALAAREGAARFWSTQATAPLERPAEAAALAAALRQGLESELAAASALRRDHAAQAKTVADLRAELERLTGGAETVLEVRAAFRAEPGARVPVRLHYRLPDAGWSPVYVLDARPAEGVVRFSWDATVWQGSGRPWKDVRLALATAEFRTGATPPELRPWEPGPAQAAWAKAEPAMLTRAAAPQAQENYAAADAAPAPRTEGAVFDTYDAGRATLASGDRTRLPIARQTWKADFDYLVRPYAEPRAYLRARLALGDAPRIPSGRADLLLEGALVQRVPFELARAEADLFFGADPQLAVTFRNTDRASGEAGLFGGRGRHRWAWTVEVRNGKAGPARVSVQDRLPRPGDERIKLEKTLAEGAREKDDAVIWDFELAPGAARTIDYGYALTWPGDMDMDLGGR